MLEFAPHDNGQQNQRFAVRLGTQKSDHGQLGHIKFKITHDTLEGFARGVHIGKMKIESIVLELTNAQSMGVGIVAKQGGECEGGLCHDGVALEGRDPGGAQSAKLG